MRRPLHTTLYCSCVLWGLTSPSHGAVLPPSPAHCVEAHRLVAELSRTLDAFGVELTGYGGRMPHEIETFSLSCRYTEELDQELARALFLQVIDCFAEAVNKDRKIRPYLAEYPFPLHRLEVHLMVDPGGSPCEEGGLSLVSIHPESGQLLFYTASPHGPVLLEEGKGAPPLTTALQPEMGTDSSERHPAETEFPSLEG